jgi:hypothetical protein
MTIDEVMEKINAAPKGEALDVAQSAISKMSDDDKELAGDDLEAMAVLIDEAVREI